MLLCKPGSQQALCHCSYTCGDLLFIQVCSDATPKHCSTGQGKIASLCCSVLLCKTGSQHACPTAITPMETCSTYRCALMHHQSTAALVKAEQLPCCSVLLCKAGSQQALCHCKYLYGDLLNIQVCSDATPKHCSTGQGRIASLLSSAALQTRLTAGTVSL